MKAVDQTPRNNLCYLARKTEEMSTDERMQFFLGLVGAFSQLINHQVWTQAVDLALAMRATSDPSKFAKGGKND